MLLRESQRIPLRRADLKGLEMSFLVEVIEFTLAGFFVGLGFWWAFVVLGWYCGWGLLRKIMK